MKKILVLLLVLVLTACQSTTNTTDVQDTGEQEVVPSTETVVLYDGYYYELFPEELQELMNGYEDIFYGVDTPVLLSIGMQIPDTEFLTLDSGEPVEMEGPYVILALGYDCYYSMMMLDFIIESEMYKVVPYYAIFIDSEDPASYEPFFEEMTQEIPEELSLLAYNQEFTDFMKNDYENEYVPTTIFVDLNNNICGGYTGFTDNEECYVLIQEYFMGSRLYEIEYEGMPIHDYLVFQEKIYDYIYNPDGINVPSEYLK